ncbi:hypothetical protein ACQ5SP_08240 [Rhodovulum sp. YNF3179]
MAIERHPVTGVELNPTVVERTALDFDDAVTAHLMRLKGEKFQTIAQKLGTNTFRVGEVLRGDVHPKAATEALRLVN